MIRRRRNVRFADIKQTANSAWSNAQECENEILDAIKLAATSANALKSISAEHPYDVDAPAASKLLTTIYQKLKELSRLADKASDTAYIVRQRYSK